tara:strand:- start:335 stop:460 length:126 start_codon:yes stop_codon:yes gene_type:complete
MNQFDPIMPVLIGGALGLFAVIGVKEFIKESSMAFKKAQHR